MRATLQALSRRLCWRVTGGVFASILLIESLILVPSTLRFENEALRQRAAEARAAVEGVLAARPGRAQGRQRTSPRLILHSPLDREVIEPSRRLLAVESGVHFAFAWLAFNPHSEIVRGLP